MSHDLFHDGMGQPGSYLFVVEQDRVVLLDRTAAEGERMLLDGVDETGTVQRVRVDAQGKVLTTKKRLSASGAVGATPVVIDLSQYEPPVTIILNPGAGNVLRCEIQLGGEWFSWPLGDVSAVAHDVWHGSADAVRFSRPSGSSEGTYAVKV